MSRDIDWKETEWIVTQLRAKLAEDEAQASEKKEEPQGETLAEYRANRRKQNRRARTQKPPVALNEQSEAPIAAEAAPVEEASIIEEAAPVEEIAPIVEAASLEEAMPAAEEIAAPLEQETLARESVPAAAPAIEDVAHTIEAEPAMEELAAEQAPADTEPARIEEIKPHFVPSPDVFVEDGVAYEDEEAVAVSDDEGEILEPTAATPREPVYVPVPPPQRRRMLFAAAHEEEKPIVSPKKRSQSKRAQRTAPISPRTEEEVRAELTLEHLMQDLFGADADRWFGEQPHAQQAAKAAAQPVAKEQPVASPAPVAVKEQPKRAVPAVAQEEPEVETITRENDGQIAMVLPETGKPLALPSDEQSRAHTEYTKRRERDDEQIDLFSKELAPENRLEERLVGKKREIKRAIESSDEDFNLLMELDYENELGNAIGFEKIRRHHEDSLNGLREEEQGKRRRRGERREYKDQSQDTTIRKYYNKQKKEHVARPIITFVLTALLLLYEQGEWLSRTLEESIFNGARYPTAYILIGLQILLIAAFFSRQRLLEGFWRIVRFSPIDYSLCSVMLIAAVLYHLLLIFFYGEGVPRLYLSPVAAALTMLALADLLDWVRESASFRVIASRKQKYALVPRVSVGGRHGDARYALESDDSDGTVWYLQPVGFVRNYFANTERRVEHGRSLGVLLLMTLSIGVALGMFRFATGGSIGDLLQTVYVTFLICAPVTSLLITSFPMWMATKLRIGKKGAIIGEEPVVRCGGTATLVIPDAEVFGAMHHERFEVVDEEDPDEVVRLVRALLENLKSPLSDSVSVERDRRIPPAAVTLLEIADDGVSATVDPHMSPSVASAEAAATTTDAARVPILMGSVQYLRAKGIEVQIKPEYEFEQSGKRLICVAVQGRVAALFLARYRLNDDMLELLRELEEENVRIKVRTKDPGIDDSLFQSLLPDRREPVRVMKPTAKEIDLHTNRVDATVVALGSCRAAARVFIACRRVRNAGVIGRFFQWLSVGLGATAMALSTLFGTGRVRGGIAIVGYMLFWCGVHALTSYLRLRERNS